MALAQSKLRIAAVLCGMASIALSVPAEAQWGGYGGHRGGRQCPMGDCGYRRPPSPGSRVGMICYNFAGKPYVYKGIGRCPIS